MDDIVVIDNFLSEEELANMASAFTYKNDYWRIHGSNPVGSSRVGDFETSFLNKPLILSKIFLKYFFITVTVIL